MHDGDSFFLVVLPNTGLKSNKHDNTPYTCCETRTREGQTEPRRHTALEPLNPRPETLNALFSTLVDPIKEP